MLKAATHGVPPASNTSHGPEPDPASLAPLDPEPPLEPELLLDPESLDPESPDPEPPLELEPLLDPELLLELAPPLEPELPLETEPLLERSRCSDHRLLPGSGPSSLPSMVPTRMSTSIRSPFRCSTQRERGEHDPWAGSFERARDRSLAGSSGSGAPIRHKKRLGANRTPLAPRRFIARTPRGSGAESQPQPCKRA